MKKFLCLENNQTKSANNTLAIYNIKRVKLNLWSAQSQWSRKEKNNWLTA